MHCLFWDQSTILKGQRLPAARTPCFAPVFTDTAFLEDDTLEVSTDSGLKFLQMRSEAGCGLSMDLIVFDDWCQTDKSLILVSLVTILYALLGRSQLL